MRFIGCKESLLPALGRLVKERGIENGVFCDLFAGTASVGRHFRKAGFRVWSTDILKFSYVLQKTYLEIDECPSFAKLGPTIGQLAYVAGQSHVSTLGAKATIDYLNNLEGEDGFIFRSYSPEGTKGSRYVRRYFTADNARKIDAVRNRVENWKTAGLISNTEYNFLLCSIIEAVPFVANISGTYSAFLKSWDARALKPLTLKLPNLVQGPIGSALNSDGVGFLSELKKKIDVLYLDPPYNGRQYASNYHILETIARWDSPLLHGVTGMRDCSEQKSIFCNRRGALEGLTRIIDNANSRHIIMSYNDDGLLAKKELLSILSRHGNTDVVETDYQRFKSNGGGSGRKRVTERLYFSKAIHPNNKLNDLCGSEWLYFLKSAEVTKYATSGEESYAHHLRKMHPSPKPPQLMRMFVEFFTKKNELVLDPFMGVGGVPIACSLVGRKCVGIDLSKEYILQYHAVCKELKLRKQRAIIGDALHLSKLLRSKTSFDLVLTDPPYGEMLSRKHTGQRRKTSGVAEASPFTTKSQDLGNMLREDFFASLKEIIWQATTMLKPKGYIVIFAKDMQPQGKNHNMLHSEIVEKMLEIPLLSFRGYKIWVDQTPNLYPFGYPHAFVSNQLHQFALIFRKELR